MSSPLAWKVYNEAGEMVASTRYAEDAAAVVALSGSGLVKRDGRIVWREGTDGQAGESYDQAAGLMRHRTRLFNQRRLERLTGVS